MTCVIGSPSSNSGKTILSLLLTAWANHYNLKLQSFKVGPDYLDQQQLTYISKINCQNLDTFLTSKDWVVNRFYELTSKSDVSLIEGVMGLFDGVGSSDESSTAEIAKLLNLPIILIIDAHGQSRSIAALIKGFTEFDQEINIIGVVFNNVNSKRHESILREATIGIGLKILGCLPSDPNLKITSGNLGLKSPYEKVDNVKINYLVDFAERYLDLVQFEKLLKSPKVSRKKTMNSLLIPPRQKNFSIAIANDKVFHFRYPETIEYLESQNINVIPWRPYENELIPKEAKGLIIPGGFPERFADELSYCKKSIMSLIDFHKKAPIYAECGGMLLLGDYIYDETGKKHKMAGILPFSSKKGNLKVGYRLIRGIKDSLISRKDAYFKGHEFHYWEIFNEINSQNINSHSNTNKYSPPWEIRNSSSNYIPEGWSNNMIHASWIHLHWPTSNQINNFLNYAEKLIN
tara:strand:- start:11458 stop:12840 length:1383 start_codon:yes stop_codon:yes gene_type:complete